MRKSEGRERQNRDAFCQERLADLIQVAGGKFVFTEDNIISFFEINSDSDEYAAIIIDDVYSPDISLHVSKLRKATA